MGLSNYLDSQVAGNNRPLYPKVDHSWFKVAHNYEPLALQVLETRRLSNGRTFWLPGLVLLTKLQLLISWRLDNGGL